MRKRKHDFKSWHYSDKQMEAMCSYQKKFVVSFRMDTELLSVGAVLSYDKEESRFSVLRRLVKLKHQTIINFNSMSIGIKKTVLTHEPKFKIPESSKFIAHSKML